MHKGKTSLASEAVSTQTIVLHIPDDLYARVRLRAAQSQRSVEAEFVSVLAEAMPGDDELPLDLTEALAALKQLDDDDLWAIARAFLKTPRMSRRFCTISGSEWVYPSESRSDPTSYACNTSASCSCAAVRH